VLALAAVLAAVLAGCLLAFRFGGFTSLAPRWAGALLIFGGGTAAGIGMTSCIFVLCRIAAPGLPFLPLVVEGGVLAWLIFGVARHWAERGKPVAVQGFPWSWLLGIAAAGALALGTMGMVRAWETNPQGNWDAWSIWNLRAKYLAAPGELPNRAWSAQLTGTHPEYPLLLSGFVARCWAYAHDTPDVVPITTSYLFFLALIALAMGALAALRGGSLGLLCGLVLVGTPSLLHEVPAQYADIPLACFYAGTLLFLLLDKPVAAGVFAAFTAWTKDEGFLFLVVLFAVLAIWRRARLLPAAAGALPVVILALVFKLAMAGGHSLVSADVPGMGARLGTVSRYGTILGAFWSEFWSMRSGWYHPILPLLALAVSLRFKRQFRAQALFAGAVAGLTLSGYFAVYTITPNDLTWQLQTSLNRIFVQIWPLLVLAAFLALTPPEDLAIARPEPARARRKGKT
jgi:hypothetical protein